jgi:pantoate--beta-alanine ligase
MELVRRVRSMREVCLKARANGRKVGLVPTMGALHEGHVVLIRRVKEVADVVVVSVFVNPAQFGPGEDYESYPRDLARDVDACIAEQVDYVFAPAVEELYPPGAETFVETSELSRVLEGASRPGHFRGVATVVTKLFHVVHPTVAAFGKKDAQQVAVVQRMVRDLMMDVEILVVPIVRDADGLALSSRNRRLAPEGREAALAVPRALRAAERALADGQRQPAKLAAAARDVLESERRLRVDYVEIVDPEGLMPLSTVAEEMLLLVAVEVGGVRLIDNVYLHA